MQYIGRYIFKVINGYCVFTYLINSSKQILKYIFLLKK